MVGFIKVITFPFRTIYGYVKSVNTLLNAPVVIGDKYNSMYTTTTKVVGVTVGSCGAAKGVADAAEALACQDGVCFVVSCVGASADVLHMLASFVPGPNFTAVVTVPLSMGCKTFVYCCKRGKMPWNRMC
jgi:hypothetical protein